MAENRFGLDFEKGQGLIPAIVQDAHDGIVLMLAYVNEEALDVMLETGKAAFYSRSRNSLWIKGETSGNFQLVREIRKDCDGDTLLIKVESMGPACHTGNRSCFYRLLNEEESDEGEKE